MVRRVNEVARANSDRRTFAKENDALKEELLRNNEASDAHRATIAQLHTDLAALTQARL